MAEWLKGCDICNVKFMEHMDEKIDGGMKILTAAKELHKEMMDELGYAIYTERALMQRYREYKNIKVKETLTSIDQGFKDLKRHIKSVDFHGGWVLHYMTRKGHRYPERDIEVFSSLLESQKIFVEDLDKQLKKITKK